MAKILVVEDNPTNLELICYLLRAFGHQVTEATSGAEALDRAGREPLDLVLCDIQLPDTNGIDLVRRLKSEAGLTHCSYVAVTAFAMVGDRERLLQAGFDGYLDKPIDPETFNQQLGRFLPEAGRGAAPAAPPPQPQTVPQHTTRRDQRAVLLVVDDRAVNRDLLVDTLAPAGYQVITSGSVDQALERLRRSRPQVVIADVHMPGGSGFDLLLALQRDPLLQDLPVIMVTATAKEAPFRRHALALGAAAYLTYPLDIDELLAAVAGCLEETPDGDDPGR